MAECRTDTGKPPLTLPGMSEDALIVLAGHNGDEQSAYQSQPMLVDAGIPHGEARAVSVKLYVVLSGSRRSEKTGARGRYRLVSSEDEPNNPPEDLL